MCIYLLLSAFCGWYLWSIGAVLGLSFMETLGIVLLINGLIFAYASYQIHRHSNEMIIGGITVFLIIVVYWLGIWRLDVVIGGFMHLVVVLSYFHWKRHYPHLENFTDLLKAIYHRQANAAHIL